MELYQPFKPEPSLSRSRSIVECIAEVERELGVRYRCFNLWQRQGKLSSIDAADRFERLRGALAFLDQVRSISPDAVEPTRPTPAQCFEDARTAVNQG